MQGYFFSRLLMKECLHILIVVKWQNLYISANGNWSLITHYFYKEFKVQKQSFNLNRIEKYVDKTHCLDKPHNII